MQFVTYLLTSLVSFLGISVGTILVFIAPEEQKPLKKYTLFFQYGLLLLIFLFSLFFFFIQNKLIFSGLLLLLFTSIYLMKNHHFPSPIIYLFLAVVFYMGSLNQNLFIIESTLIFLYGITTGILLTKRRKKNYASLLFLHGTFLVGATILFFLPL